jgi:Spy/CpxP family protein refolding chaperone
MNNALIIALAALLAPFAAQAAEPAAAPVKPLQSAPTPAPAAASKPATPQKTAAPQTTPSVSQQDRMRDCNKQASGKKGDERKAFMKTCLSSKA